ncbi:YeiH family protein [Cumulibacter soli]|uniref:YeiH family protein n=1 Tax=Cumulibacter soli TaxID=2546344 RepID=UPI001ABBBF81|nr:putative sulfate exporter family transporter [Cumulibacter soli]
MTVTATRGQNALTWTKSVLPGLLMAGAGAGIGYLVHAWLPGVQPGTIAVALGALCVNLRMVPDAAGSGLTFASKKLLRVAVVLLGFALSLRQVAELGGPGLLVVLITVTIAFFGTIALARVLRVRRATGLLVATGFSICGASAIAAMEPLAKGKKDDTAVSVALVTLCGSLAIIVLPLLSRPLGLTDPLTFGQWVGASVHDVGQVVATGNAVPGSLESAVVVKLTRVILLAPLVFGVGLYLSQRRHAETSPSRKRPALIPLFVACFIGAILLNSIFTFPETLLDIAGTAQEILLAVALFALGTGISWRVMRRAGGRPLLLGLLSWVLVAGVAYCGVVLIT